MTRLDLPIESIKELYNKGVNTFAIAEEFKCSPQTVKRRLQKCGIPIRNRGQANKLDPRRHFTKIKLDIEAIREMYETSNLRKVATASNCAMSTIRRRLIDAGITLRKPDQGLRDPCPTGDKHGNWNGGKTHQRDGYIMVVDPTHPRAGSSGRVLEHIWVWEKTHHKMLPDGWVVHHLNGVKHDNSPENLIDMSRSKHHSLNEPYKKKNQRT